MPEGMEYIRKQGGRHNLEYGITKRWNNGLIENYILNFYAFYSTIHSLLHSNPADNALG